MAYYVISAFNEFQKNIVNLDSNVSSKARSSRDWLIDQISYFPNRDTSFPQLYTEKDINFGSFARRTKKRPLDDIDIMICLHAQGSYYTESLLGLQINVPENIVNLKALCHDNILKLNSRKVINKFVSNLQNISQYGKADISRNKEAATIKLASYDWNFDIVPCFITNPDYLGNTFYFIPDGSGDWKKTDPRKDRDRVQRVNTRNDGNVLNVIRIMKYWNNRPTMPSINSYLLENIILDYYEINHTHTASQYVDFEVQSLLLHIRNSVYGVVNDPKGIQGDLNNLTPEEKSKIWDRAHADHNKATEARNFETDSRQKESINKWREIFGWEFPTYG